MGRAGLNDREQPQPAAVPVVGTVISVGDVAAACKATAGSTSSAPLPRRGGMPYAHVAAQAASSPQMLSPPRVVRDSSMLPPQGSGVARPHVGGSGHTPGGKKKKGSSD